jgi:hypothetical protein
MTSKHTLLVDVNASATQLVSPRSQYRIFVSAGEDPVPLFSEHVKPHLECLQRTLEEVEGQLTRSEKHLVMQSEQSFKLLQIDLAKTQLEESRKATKRADTVVRLTIFAFVFILTSAVCSFFGINIVEVSPSGGFKFWVFDATMGTVLGTTLILAFAENIFAISSYYVDNLRYQEILWSSRWYLRLTNSITR